MSKSTLRVLTVSMLFVCISATGNTFAGGSTQKLAGIWEFAGQPDDTCGAPAFVNLATISNDGTLINLDPTEGTSVGRIQFVPQGGYEAHFVGYIANTGGLNFEVFGQLSLTDSVTLDGTYTVDLKDPGGTVLCSWGGTIIGTRLD